jgi:hypothetical protein
MKSSILQLVWFLEAAAVLQLGIAVLNLFLARLLNWREAILQMPLLVREVFRVHAWFISIMLAIFATMTFRFSRQMAEGADPVCQWLAASIGLFWLIRTVLQVTYYSSSHWRGQMGRTVAHVALLAVYGGFSATYLWAAFGARAY